MKQTAPNAFTVRPDVTAFTRSLNDNLFRSQAASKKVAKGQVAQLSLPGSEPNQFLSPEERTNIQQIKALKGRGKP